MNTITLTPVAGSSLIAADGWSEDKTTLRVRYHNNQEYDFNGLSFATHAAYEAAPSKGSYLKRQIEPNIRGVKVSQ
jgi:hypothetical protein